MQSASSWKDSYRDSRRLFIWSSFRFSTFVNFSCFDNSPASPPSGFGTPEVPESFLGSIGGRPPVSRMLSFASSELGTDTTRLGCGTGEGAGWTLESRFINLFLSGIGLLDVSFDWKSSAAFCWTDPAPRTMSSSSASLSFFVFFFLLFFLVFFFGPSSFASWTVSMDAKWKYLLTLVLLIWYVPVYII